MIVLGLVLALCGCAAPQGAFFRNPANGEVVKACAPLPGLAMAVNEAEHGCMSAYEQQGWTRVAGTETPAPAR